MSEELEFAPFSQREVNDAFRGMLECALWSSTDEDGRPLDETRDIDDIETGTVESLREDLESFIAFNVSDLEGMSPEQIGHDFWLTRNGHGAGFWDRGLGEVGDRLSVAAKVYGSVDLYVGDDGQVHA